MTLHLSPIPKEWKWNDLNGNGMEWNGTGNGMERNGRRMEWTRSITKAHDQTKP